MDYNDALEKQMLYADAGGPSYFQQYYYMYGVPAFELWTAYKTMLEVADTYYISSEVLQLLGECSKGYPTDVIIDPPPTPTGFCWMEQPRWLTDEIAIEGFLWHQNPSGRLMVFPFIRSKNLLAAPFGLGVWDGNETVQAAVERSINMEVHEAYRNMSAVAVLIFASFTAFVKQRILRTAQQHPHRPTQRRLKHLKRDVPMINVIKLRTVQYQGADHEASHRSVDWACKWLVRGHWRKQYYPSEKLNRAIFIAPYIKGPEDKPLHVAKNVYEVAR